MSNVSEMKRVRYEEIIRQTPKSWQIRFPDGIVEWIPKSQARLIGNDLYVEQWIIQAKGIEDYVEA